MFAADVCAQCDQRLWWDMDNSLLFCLYKAERTPGDTAGGHLSTGHSSNVYGLHHVNAVWVCETPHLTTCACPSRAMAVLRKVGLIDKNVRGLL
jgi:hypothetical protein